MLRAARRAFARTDAVMTRHSFRDRDGMVDGNDMPPAPRRATRPRGGGPERGRIRRRCTPGRGVVNARAPMPLGRLSHHHPVERLQPAAFALFTKGGRRRAAAAGGFALHPDSRFRRPAKRTCSARKSLRRKVDVPVCRVPVCLQCLSFLSNPIPPPTPHPGRAGFSPLLSSRV